MKLSNTEAYNYRDVVGLNPVAQWTSEEESVQKRLNRILQPGFSVRSADEMIADAKLSGVRFIPEICCPSVEAALTLHLAKDMAIKYKIDIEKIGEEVNKAYFALDSRDSGMKNILNTSIEAEMRRVGTSD